MFLSAAPLLLSRRYGLTPAAIGGSLFLVGAGIIAGMLIARRLGRHGPARLVPVAAALLGVAALLMGLLAGWPGAGAWRW